jgi:hypothetical protein
MRSRLYGLGPYDPMSMLFAVGMMIGRSNSVWRAHLKTPWPTTFSFADAEKRELARLQLTNSMHLNSLQ